MRDVSKVDLLIVYFSSDGLLIVPSPEKEDIRRVISVCVNGCATNGSGMEIITSPEDRFMAIAIEQSYNNMNNDIARLGYSENLHRVRGLRGYYKLKDHNTTMLVIESIRVLVKELEMFPHIKQAVIGRFVSYNEHVASDMDMPDIPSELKILS